MLPARAILAAATVADTYAFVTLAIRLSNADLVWYERCSNKEDSAFQGVVATLLRAMTDPEPIRSAASSDPDLSGQTLGDYQLLRRLGHGAMAEVYLAQQCSLRRQVALKILKSELASDENYVQRFHHEAQSAASLVHANIVQIHEVGRVGTVHYIAQEYVQGLNLRQYITRKGAVSTSMAVRIMRQVTAALHKAGEHGIVHRDIKPENIMLSTGGEVKVADFGLARATGDGSALELTQVGFTMGTPLYMSPEQAEGRSLDPRSDIYSFGVTCYHMLAGRPPFEGDSALSIALQHARTEPERLETLRGDLPEWLCRIVHKMMTKRPEGRYQRASLLLRDLRGGGSAGQPEDAIAEWGDEGTAELDALASPASDTTRRLDSLMKTSSTQLLRRSQRVKWFRVGAIVAVLAAFLIGAVLAWLTREPPLLRLSAEEREMLVERCDNVRAQYFYALMLNTERAWQSVWQLFPEEEDQRNRYYAQLARLQLARYYLQPDVNNVEQAMEIFRQLVALDDTERQFRAYGLAGQATVYHLRQQYRESAVRVARLRTTPELWRQLSPQAREEVERIGRANQQALRRS